MVSLGRIPERKGSPTGDEHLRVSPTAWQGGWAFPLPHSPHPAPQDYPGAFDASLLPAQAEGAWARNHRSLQWDTGYTKG